MSMLRRTKNRTADKRAGGLIVALAACLVTVACASTTPANNPSPLLTAAEFHGELTVDDISIPAQLRIEPQGDGIRATLMAESSTLAIGIGQWVDGRVFVGFSYGASSANACPGRLLLTASQTLEGTHLAGPIRVQDCTGSTTGTASFDLYSLLPQHEVTTR